MSNLNPSRENGWSLLHYAAKEGHLKVFKFIANTLVDKNPKSSAMEGKTPLHIAAEYGKVEICKYIMKKMEEKVSPTNESGVYIRNKKLEVSPKMDNGRTPLHLGMDFFIYGWNCCQIFLVICPHEAGTWNPNYTPGVDFLDHDFL